MASYLLDSDALIDLLNKIPASVAVFRELSARGETLCVCSVVVAEVYAGLSDEGAVDADEIIQACEFLSTDSQTAKQAGVWRYQFARQGLSHATTDVLVAATAFAHNAIS